MMSISVFRTLGPKHGILHVNVTIVTISFSLTLYPHCKCAYGLEPYTDTLIQNDCDELMTVC